VDLARRFVLRAGEQIHLTPIEFRLLAALVKNAGKVITHEQLLREVWGRTALSRCTMCASTCPACDANLRRTLLGPIPAHGDRHRLPPAGRVRGQAMKLTIAHQERYARDHLILRTLFGWFYIGVPHVLLLLFVGVWSLILALSLSGLPCSTERFQRGIFDWQLEYLNWGLRWPPRLPTCRRIYGVFPGGFQRRKSACKSSTRRTAPVAGVAAFSIRPALCRYSARHCLLGRFAATCALMFLAW